MNQFPHVFSPITIRGKTYKNRLIAAPTMFAHSIFTIPEMRENVYRMVENRAKGGFAAVSTGEHPVNGEEGTALFYEHIVDFTKPEGPDFEAIKEYADRIKKHGALCYFEFCHEGARAEYNPPYSPWGPDAYVREDGVEVKALDRPMMERSAGTTTTSPGTPSWPALTACWSTAATASTCSSSSPPGPTTAPTSSAAAWKTGPASPSCCWTRCGRASART